MNYDMKYTDKKDNKINNIIKESELFDNDNFINEDDDAKADKSKEIESEISDDVLKVDCLKVSTKIIRMLDRCDVSDLLEISDLVMRFLKNYVPGADIKEVLGLEDIKTPDSSEEETETPEEEETPADSEEDINLDDLDDFTIEDDEEDNKESEDEDDDTNEGSSEVPDQFII